MEEPIENRETTRYRRKYDHCKSIVLKWETAFAREKGKQPTKTDFDLAPRPVQVAYLTYLEIKRLLSKIGRGNDCIGSLVRSEGKRRTPIESPARIFPRRNSSGKECVEEYDPVLEKSLRSKNLMDGIMPLPPTPAKISPRMQALLPRLKFHFRTPSKQNSKLEEGAPFGKLSSKLFMKETEEFSKSGLVRRPHLKLESKVVKTPLDKEATEFSEEMDSILLDVKKAMETYECGDGDDFEDDMTTVSVTDSVDADLGLSFGCLPEPKLAKVSSKEFSMSTLLHPETVQTPQIYNPEKVLTKSRIVNKGWIERCSFVDAQDAETVEVETKGEKCLPQPNLENGHISSLLNPNAIVEASAKAIPESRILPTPVTEVEETKRVTRSSTVLINSTAESKPMDAAVESSKSTKKFFKSMKSRAIVKSIKSPIKQKKKTVKEPKVAPEKKRKVAKPSTSVSKRGNSGKNTVPVREKKPTPAIDKMVQEMEHFPAQKRKASELSEFDYMDDQTEAADNVSKKPRKRIRLTRQKQANENFVRIDVTKKRFVRGKRKLTGMMDKKQNWKLKKKQAATEFRISILKCKKCGGVGHFAKFCMKELHDQNTSSEAVDNSPFPSLEEAARMIWSKKATDASINGTFVFGEANKSSPREEKGETDKSDSAILHTVEEKSDSLNPMDVDGDDEDEHRLVLVAHDDNVSGDMDLNSTQYEQDSMQSISESQLNGSMSSGFDSSFALNGFKQGEENPAAQNSYIRPIFETLAVTNDHKNCPVADSDAKILEEALGLFGYSDFRAGQKAAITRVLQGESTLVVLSTGSGKSLCYLLPAYIYAKKYPGSLTICISPLVSLMEDQVQSIPPFLSGACLHTHMSSKQRDLVIERVRQRELQILLVSPEAVCGGLFGLLRNVHDFPPVSFACIDEVHCVSEWSHNFRPSYLRLCQILQDRLNVKTILGLTATATKHTIASVCEHLRIDPNSVIRGEIVPSNLRLSCSRDLDREDALIALLNSKRFESCDSIIVYCTRREQCERIATLIRTMLTQNVHGVIKENYRRRISAECETYHAGMSSARRKSVQTNFMAGKIRIVVATVAFGMGIDKSDIRAVIHYNMPKTFESYIQEIGRAGRDGLPAECHLFLDGTKGKDICELKRHIFSNSIERPSLRKLLSRIFKSCTCQRTGKIRGLVSDNPEVKTAQKKPCPGHEISFTVEETVKELDLPDENIETILCYLERYPHKKLIEMLPKCYHMCTIQSYGGTNLLKSSARNCAALAAAIAVQKEKKQFKDEDLHFEFNFIEVARTLGWSSTQMRKELKSLEWTGSQFDGAGNPTRFRKSGIIVGFSDLAYRMITHGTLSNQELDKVLNYLHGRNTDQERMELFQLYRIYDCMLSNSCKSVEDVSESYVEDKSNRLKQLILDYFNSTDIGVPADWKPPISTCDTHKKEMIRQDMRKLLQNHGDLEFSSRAMAKIFQGIPSPCFPAEDWCRNRAFWRRYIDVDFHVLLQLAGEEIC